MSMVCIDDSLKLKWCGVWYTKCAVEGKHMEFKLGIIQHQGVIECLVLGGRENFSNLRHRCQIFWKSVVLTVCSIWSDKWGALGFWVCRFWGQKYLMIFLRTKIVNDFFEDKNSWWFFWGQKSRLFVCVLCVFLFLFVCLFVFWGQKKDDFFFCLGICCAGVNLLSSKFNCNTLG